MEITTTYNGNKKSLLSSDNNGKFDFSVIGLKIRPIQISLEHEDVGDSYITVDLKEMEAIRDLLNEAISIIKESTEN